MDTRLAAVLECFVNGYISKETLVDMIYQIRKYGYVKHTGPHFSDGECILTGEINRLLGK